MPKSNDKAATVLVVDDHPVVLAGVETFLDSTPDFRIVGTERNAAAAIQRARELEPELILLDASLPDMPVADAAQQLALASPQARILVFAAELDAREQGLVSRAGAAGYLGKDSERDVLLNALQGLIRGEQHFSEPPSAPADPSSEPAPPSEERETSSLSRRELEVLVRIAEGSTNKQIADRLGISVRTVETHRENLMRKLGVQGTAALTKWAVSRGLVDPRK